MECGPLSPSPSRSLLSLFFSLSLSLSLSLRRRRALSGLRRRLSFIMLAVATASLEACARRCGRVEAILVGDGEGKHLSPNSRLNGDLFMAGTGPFPPCNPLSLSRTQDYRAIDCGGNGWLGSTLTDAGLGRRQETRVRRREPDFPPKAVQLSNTAAPLVLTGCPRPAGLRYPYIPLHGEYIYFWRWRTQAGIPQPLDRMSFAHRAS